MNTQLRFTSLSNVAGKLGKRMGPFILLCKVNMYILIKNKSISVCSVLYSYQCYFLTLLVFASGQVNQFYFDRLTCVYASCKVEENHVSAEELGKGIQQDHQIILNNEMIVLKVCHFHIQVL